MKKKLQYFVHGWRVEGRVTTEWHLPAKHLMALRDNSSLAEKMSQSHESEGTLRDQVGT